MRIAVSGTHCSGKSTLILSFLAQHPDFEYEPEAYELLDESLSAEPSAEEFFQQLEYHVEQLKRHRHGDRFIIERSPADYVAYINALIVLSRDRMAEQLLSQAVDVAHQAMEMLDVVFFLSTCDTAIHVPDEEDSELRSVVNDLLESSLLNDELKLFSSKYPLVVEVLGTAEQRLAILERTIRTYERRTRI